MAISILHLDDDPGFSASVKPLFEPIGMEIILTLVRSGSEFQRALEAGAYDLILAEYSLPDYAGLSALKEARLRRPRVPFIFLAATRSDEAATESLRLGAADFVAKSDLRRVPAAVERALRNIRETDAPRKEREETFFKARTAFNQETHSPLAPHPEFRSLRILVAEDNTVNQVVVARLLEAVGCGAPHVVGDGREALAAFRKQEYDIVFMDCHMPDLDGYIATARIRRLEARGNGKRRCYIAAMTADIMPGVEEKCLAAGMDGQLTKPYSIEGLVATLERARKRAAAGEFRSAQPPEPSRDEASAGGPGSQGSEWGDIDIRILDRLRLLGGKESQSMFRELVGGFLDTVPGKITVIRELARTREFRLLAFAAHGLKGLCLNFGAISMARECEALQVASENVRLAALPRILERLSAAEAGTRTFLEGMIGAGAADAGTPSAGSGAGGFNG